ncbi:MAG: phosphatidylserine decarboxylase family protein [Saprospiraceae bacterium]|nr:phosphatidylserine decarboxylase family protein [Saprospiraceae bacterium]
MKLHKEGLKYSLLALILLAACWILAYYYPTLPMLLASALLSVIVLWVFYFFRDPDRTILTIVEENVLAPADGKVVVIEEVEETEFFNETRIQVSIFMSPLNVHVNRAPVSGKYTYVRHHPGRFLAAWDPKSSTDNERSSIVIENPKFTLLLRQIAGAMARRIITYAVEGQEVQQGDELGFIKFGSRVDVVLPLNAQIKVGLGQKVKGNRTVIATI